MARGSKLFPIFQSLFVSRTLGKMKVGGGLMEGRAGVWTEEGALTGEKCCAGLGWKARDGRGVGIRMGAGRSALGSIGSLGELCLARPWRILPHVVFYCLILSLLFEVENMQIEYRKVIFCYIDNKEYENVTVIYIFNSFIKTITLGSIYRQVKKIGCQ